jgi:hypothetical protein
MPMRGALCLLNMRERALLPLIDGGDIRWVFDISITKRNREFRILYESVEAYRMGRPCLLYWPQVIRLLVPNPSLATVTGSFVAHVLNCSDRHVARLIESRILRGKRNGQCYTASIVTDSFLQFLKERQDFR